MNMLMRKTKLSNKDNIRKEILNIRNNISDKEKKSTIIVNKIMKLEVFQKAKVIALYNSMVNEVDTNSLINELLNKKVVLLPKIVDNQMVFIPVKNNQQYIKSTFGVLEPIGESYNGDIHLIIVPGVAFDESMNRLGYGKGYYDKFLSNKNIYKIGICFDRQLINKLPTNNYDIKMDMIITEERIIKKV